MVESVLIGRYIRLEPLGLHHAEQLMAAGAEDASLYRWTPVPQSRADMLRYIETALDWRDAGTAAPFAIVRLSEGAVIGSTRFWNLERWAWPPGHARRGGTTPDVCEIGWT